MKAFIQKQLKNEAFLVVVALLLGSAIVYAASDLAYFLSGIGGNGFQIPNGITARIDSDKIIGGSSSDCRLVTNNTGSTIYVPTNSLAEWNAFVSGHPAGISLAGCAATCSYSWSGTMTICAASMAGNTFPYMSQMTSQCVGSSDAGKYMIISPPNNWGDMTCNPGDAPAWGDHVRYAYAVCNATCTGGGGASCTAPWGATVNSGDSIVGYSSGIPGWGPTVSGSAANQTSTCNSSADVGLTNVVVAGTSYRTCVASCDTATAICNSGTLTSLGADTNQSCIVPAGKSWHFTWSATTACSLPSGSSATCDSTSIGYFNSSSGVTTGGVGGCVNPPFGFYYQVCNGGFY